MSFADTNLASLTRHPVGLNWSRLGYAAIAVTVVASGLAVLSLLISATGLAPRPAPQNPFGLPMQSAAPSTTGIGGLILAVQAQFYAALTAAVSAMKNSQAAVTSLASVGFLYGIFHAAGPGHGKGIISGYLVASRRSMWRGLTLSLAAALLQAFVAVTLVGVLVLVFNAGAASIKTAARAVEIVSFAAIAAFGLVLVWSKAGEFTTSVARARGRTDVASADHDGLPPPAALDRLTELRDMAAVVISAGIRPCSGAILLLVFAASQGLFTAGVVGAFAMALGTAITTGTLAVLTIVAKSTLLKLTKNGGHAGVLIGTGLETLAAAFVLLLGAILLSGMWTNGLPGMLD